MTPSPSTSNTPIIAMHSSMDFTYPSRPNIFCSPAGPMNPHPFSPSKHLKSPFQILLLFLLPALHQPFEVSELQQQDWSSSPEILPSPSASRWRKAASASGGAGVRRSSGGGGGFRPGGLMFEAKAREVELEIGVGKPFEGSGNG
ncbi:hypothetical protein SDJN03_13680, partial [Cucurbita argyrosperma subsp. sororia]